MSRTYLELIKRGNNSVNVTPNESEMSNPTSDDTVVESTYEDFHEYLKRSAYACQYDDSYLDEMIDAGDCYILPAKDGEDEVYFPYDDMDYRPDRFRRRMDWEEENGVCHSTSDNSNEQYLLFRRKGMEAASALYKPPGISLYNSVTYKYSKEDFKAINCGDASFNVQYSKIFDDKIADKIFQRLENEVEYLSSDMQKICIFGKVYDIPRKQVAFGNKGLSYSFSGACIPALSWDECNIIKHLRSIVTSICEFNFNFVLVNRYKDGKDHMGEHRDDEKELDPNAPIVSMSFGQARDFIFKHKDSRGRRRTRDLPPVKVSLEHGSVLVMKPPTNQFWYHSLPVRANAPNPRVNLTFRRMIENE